MEKENLVYFLLDDLEIVYIGVTGNGLQRINRHFYNKQIPFSSYTFLAFENAIDAKQFELEAIAFCWPTYNKDKCANRYLPIRTIQRYLSKASLIAMGTIDYQRPYYEIDNQREINQNFFHLLISYFPKWLPEDKRKKYTERWAKAFDA